jgi:hypothetical protein
MQIIEKENIIVLHFEKYKVTLNLYTSRGTIYLQIDDEDVDNVTSKDLSETNDQEEKEDEEPKEQLMAAISWNEGPVYTEKKNSPYQPPEIFHSATLEVLSKKQGLIYSENIKFQNYNVLYDYFSENSDLEGLFLEKADKKQYNWPGNYNGCKKIILVVSNELPKKIPKQFPQK